MKPAIQNVHPELREVARKMPQPAFNPKTLGLMRFLTKVFVRPAKMPTGIRAENIFIARPNHKAKIRLRIYRARTASPNSPALLWMHGGGYIIGAPEQDDLYVLPFLQSTGAVVVSVDYRLAPEHPFPAPLEDCDASLQWLASQGQQLGIDPQRIAIGGASAGAGLAAALAQLTHDRGGFQPMFQLLVYPMLDDRTVTRQDIDQDAHFIWTNQSNCFGWEAYLQQACGAENTPAYAAPARRSDLAGLPPAWIGVGGIDLFHAEDIAYAQRLKDAGVSCELMVVPGAFHGFDLSPGRCR